MTIRVPAFWLALCLAVAAMAACPAEEAPTAPDPAAKAPSAKVLAALAKADEADGKADKIVHKCPACMLKMNGSAEHAATLGAYTVYSCAADCKAALVADPGAILGRANP